MRIQKVSQVELVKYIGDLDEKMKDKRVKTILYNEALTAMNKSGRGSSTGSRKKQRKTVADKKYKVIAYYVRENFRTEIGDTTVWRILKIKAKSRAVFNEIERGDRSIKEAYNSLYGVENGQEAETEMKGVTETSESVRVSNLDEIIETIGKIESAIETNRDEFSSIQKLKQLDNELFTLRKAVFKLIAYHDREE